MTNRWRYFTLEEVSGLDEELVAKLDMARAKAGTPFVITSGLRTQENNERAMGVEASAHLSGKAVDLACPSGSDRFKMVAALVAVGFKRIGIYDRHVHCDTDESKPQEVIWIGTSH